MVIQVSIKRQNFLPKNNVVICLPILLKSTNFPINNHETIFTFEILKLIFFSLFVCLFVCFEQHFRELNFYILERYFQSMKKTPFKRFEVNMFIISKHEAVVSLHGINRITLELVLKSNYDDGFTSYI